MVGLPGSRLQSRPSQLNLSGLDLAFVKRGGWCYLPHGAAARAEREPAKSAFAWCLACLEQAPTAQAVWSWGMVAFGIR